ncbi:MAG: tetratricopeptide repeat protein [Desulfatirhabdiaceae bacterium]
MTAHKQPASDMVKKQTFIWVTVAAFVAGFFSGVMLTVYKSKDIHTGAGVHMAAQQPETPPSMIAELEKAAEQRPDDVTGWIQLGNACFDAGLHDKAIDAYEKALKIVPDNPNVLTDLGTMYRKAGKLDQAIEAFDRSIAIDPRHEPSRFNKGLVLMHDKNDPKGAIQVWESLLEINPMALAPGGKSVDELLRHLKEGEERRLKTEG